MKYEAPEFEKRAFTCPHCGVFSNFYWEPSVQRSWHTSGGSGYEPNGLTIARCTHCVERIIWFNEENGVHLLWPFGISNAPLPHEDMPDDVKCDYVEARSISTLSPRGAAALLRLGIQKLCRHLGEPGENINDDIGVLVKKGLPVQIQQALDVVRVTGNYAVHPGALRIEDKPEFVSALFGLLNLIVDNRIAEPKRIKALYDALPEGPLRGIEKRDS